MSFNVFYAWQMDRSTKLHRWFIETAIKKAIRQVKATVANEADLKLDRSLPLPDDAAVADPDTVPDAAEDADIVLQWRAFGTTGAGLIAETILDRIAACGVFIADLTFTAETVTADSRPKKLPNSNVLIELGAASRLVGWDRMILVTNTASGPVDDLPFDLRHRHCQVKYMLASWDDPNRSQIAKQLAADIAGQLLPMYAAEKGKAEAERVRVGAAAAAELALQEERARTARHEFEERVRQHTFYTFRPDWGIFALSIIPAIPLHTPIQFSFDDVARLRNGLPPMRIDFGTVYYHARSAITVYPDVHQFPDKDPASPKSVTEITDRGRIFAVEHWMYHDSRKPERPVAYRMNVYQPEITKSVQKYMTCLMEFGIKGPWYVGLSMLKQDNTRLAIRDGETEFEIATRTVFRGEDVTADTLRIAEDADVSSYPAVSALLKPAFDQLFRGYGFITGAPQYDFHGNFEGFWLRGELVR